MKIPTKLPAAVKHANQRGDKPRVRLNGGPFVDPATLDRLTTWQRQGVSYGALIDRLTCHAFSTGFDPVFMTSTKKKKPAPAKREQAPSLTPSPRWINAV